MTLVGVKIKRTKLEREFDRTERSTRVATIRRTKQEERKRKLKRSTTIRSFRAAAKIRFAALRKKTTLKFVIDEYKYSPISAEFVFRGYTYVLSYEFHPYVSQGIDDWGYDTWIWRLAKKGGEQNDQFYLHTRSYYSEFERPYGRSEDDKDPGDLSSRVEEGLREITRRNSGR